MTHTFWFDYKKTRVHKKFVSNDISEKERLKNEIKEGKHGNLQRNFLV